MRCWIRLNNILLNIPPYSAIVCSSFIFHRVKKGLTDGFQDTGNGYQYTFWQLYKQWRVNYIFYLKSLKDCECYSLKICNSDHYMAVRKGIIN